MQVRERILRSAATDKFRPVNSLANVYDRQRHQCIHSMYRLKPAVPSNATHATNARNYATNATDASNATVKTQLDRSLKRPYCVCCCVRYCAAVPIDRLAVLSGLSVWELLIVCFRVIDLLSYCVCYYFTLCVI